jgi:hypothetical protein
MRHPTKTCAAHADAAASERVPRRAAGSTKQNDCCAPLMRPCSCRDALATDAADLRLPPMPRL